MAELADFDDFDTGKGGYGDEDGNLLISGVDTRVRHNPSPTPTPHSHPLSISSSNSLI